MIAIAICSRKSFALFDGIFEALVYTNVSSLIPWLIARIFSMCKVFFSDVWTSYSWYTLLYISICTMKCHKVSPLSFDCPKSIVTKFASNLSADMHFPLIRIESQGSLPRVYGYLVINAMYSTYMLYWDLHRPGLYKFLVCHLIVPIHSWGSMPLRWWLTYLFRIWSQPLQYGYLMMMDWEASLYLKSIPEGRWVRDLSDYVWCWGICLGLALLMSIGWPLLFTTIILSDIVQ